MADKILESIDTLTNTILPETLDNIDRDNEHERREKGEGMKLVVKIQKKSIKNEDEVTPDIMRSSSDLPSDVHMRLHTGEKPYKCDVCGNTFTARSTLWSHVKIHTGEKDLECEVCGKRFTLISTLKKHLLIHDETYNERFDCDICGKQYMARNSMQRHRKTHFFTDPKPYNCDICDKKFSLASSMQRHKEIHFRGEMSADFECQYCGKTLSYKSSLALHMKRIHKMKIDGTPLESGDAGMFLVTDDSVAEKSAEHSLPEDSKNDDKEEIEKNKNSNNNSMDEDTDISSDTDPYAYALDLVQKEINRQFESTNNESNETESESCDTSI